MKNDLREKLRHEVHMAMLAKSESAKDLGELTVVPLGFAVNVALELSTQRILALLDEVMGKGYDDFHKTYDYDKIAEAVFEAIQAIRDSVSGGTHENT